MIIALSGKLRSGKDTTADILIKLAKSKGMDLYTHTLSSPIYDELRSFCERHNLKYSKNRRFMEGVGQLFNENYEFGDKLVELFDSKYRYSNNYICTDMRRLTQYNYFRITKEAIIIRVEANEDVRRNRCINPAEFATGHITDNELDNCEFDYTINNNSTLQELFSQCNDIFKKIIGNKNG